MNFGDLANLALKKVNVKDVVNAVVSPTEALKPVAEGIARVKENTKIIRPIPAPAVSKSTETPKSNSPFSNPDDVLKSGLSILKAKTIQLAKSLPEFSQAELINEFKSSGKFNPYASGSGLIGAVMPMQDDVNSQYAKLKPVDIEQLKGSLRLKKAQENETLNTNLANRLNIDIKDLSNYTLAQKREAWNRLEAQRYSNPMELQKDLATGAVKGGLSTVKDIGGVGIGLANKVFGLAGKPDMIKTDAQSEETINKVLTPSNAVEGVGSVGGQFLVGSLPYGIVSKTVGMVLKGMPGLAQTVGKVLAKTPTLAKTVEAPLKAVGKFAIEHPIFTDYVLQNAGEELVEMTGRKLADKEYTFYDFARGMTMGFLFQGFFDLRNFADAKSVSQANLAAENALKQAEASKGTRLTPIEVENVLRPIPIGNGYTFGSLFDQARLAYKTGGYQPMGSGKMTSLKDTSRVPSVTDIGVRIAEKPFTDTGDLSTKILNKLEGVEPTKFKSAEDVLTNGTKTDKQEFIKKAFEANGLTVDKIVRSKLDDGFYVYHQFGMEGKRYKPSKIIKQEGNMIVRETQPYKLYSDFIEDGNVMGLEIALGEAKMRKGEGSKIVLPDELFKSPDAGVQTSMAFKTGGKEELTPGKISEAAAARRVEMDSIIKAKNDIAEAKRLMETAPDTAEWDSGIKTKNDYKQYIKETQDWIDSKTGVINDGRENLPEADRDWEENYADKYSELANKAAELESQYKITKGAEKAQIKSELDSVNAEMGKMEESFRENNISPEELSDKARAQYEKEILEEVKADVEEAKTYKGIDGSESPVISANKIVNELITAFSEKGAKFYLTGKKTYKGTALGKEVTVKGAQKFKDTFNKLFLEGDIDTFHRNIEVLKSKYEGTAFGQRLKNISEQFKTGLLDNPDLYGETIRPKLEAYLDGGRKVNAATGTARKSVGEGRQKGDTNAIQNVPSGGAKNEVKQNLLAREKALTDKLGLPTKAGMEEIADSGYLEKPKEFEPNRRITQPELDEIIKDAPQTIKRDIDNMTAGINTGLGGVNIGAKRFMILGEYLKKRGFAIKKGELNELPFVKISTPKPPPKPYSINQRPLWNNQRVSQPDIANSKISETELAKGTEVGKLKPSSTMEGQEAVGDLKTSSYKLRPEQKIVINKLIANQTSGKLAQGKQDISLSKGQVQPELRQDITQKDITSPLSTHQETAGTADASSSRVGLEAYEENLHQGFVQDSYKKGESELDDTLPQEALNSQLARIYKPVKQARKLNKTMASALFSDNAKFKDLTIGQSSNLSTLAPLRAAEAMDGKRFGIWKDNFLYPLQNADKSFQIELKQKQTEMEDMFKGMNKRQREAVFNLAENKMSPLDIELVKNNPRITEVAGKLRSNYDDLLNRINAEREAIGKDPINKRQDYITHYQELNVINDVLQMFGLNFTEVPNSMLAISMYTKPNSPYFKFAKHRLTELTARDAKVAYGKYLEPALKVIHFSRAMKNARDILEYRVAIPSEYEGGKIDKVSLVAMEYPNAYKYWTEYLNAVSGKRDIQDKLYPRVAEVMGFSNRLFSAGSIGGNLSTVFTQMASIRNTAADTGVFALKGQMMINTPKGYKFFVENSRIGMGRQYEPAIKEAKYMPKTAAKVFDKVNEVISIPVSTLDREMVGGAFLSGYYKGKALGLDEADAIRYGDDVAERTQASANIVDRSPINRGKIKTSLGQFQTFVYNEWSQIKNDIVGKMIAGEKSPQGYGEGLAGIMEGRATGAKRIAGFVLATAAMSAAYDALGLPNPYKQEGAKPPFLNDNETANALFEYVINSVPGVSSVRFGGSPIVQGVYNTTIALTGNDRDKPKAISNLKALGFRLVPAGGQVSKTWGAVDVLLNEGKSYSTSGKTLNFTIDTSDLWNVSKALMFGKYQSAEGQNYINKLNGVPTKKASTGSTGQKVWVKKSFAAPTTASKKVWVKKQFAAT